MANVPISIDQGGKQMTIGAGASLVVTGDITLPVESIQTGEIGDGAVTFDKALAFYSEITGTGMEQTIAHGLGVIPNIVMFSAIDTSGTMSPGDFTITAGMHTGSNILVTATADLVFQILAWG